MSITEMTLLVDVLDGNRMPIITASVIVETDAGTLTPTYDGRLRAFVVRFVAGTPYTIIASAPTFETQYRTIREAGATTQVTMCLGHPGDSYTIIDGVEIPYRGDPNAICILGNFNDRETADRMRALLIDGPVEYRCPELDTIGVADPSGRISQTTHLVLRKVRSTGDGYASEPISPMDETILGRLREDPAVLDAGPIFRSDNRGYQILTNRLTVVFRTDITPDRAQALLTSYGLGVVERRSGGANMYNCVADDVVGTGITDYARRLLGNEAVITASVVLNSIVSSKVVNVGDYLWPALWDRKLIKSEEAWNFLDGPGGTGPEFGSENLVLAVIDDGVKSTGGMPDNPEFQGIVSRGRTAHLSSAVIAASSTITVANGVGINPGDTIALGSILTITAAGGATHGVGGEGQKTVAAVNPGPAGGTDRELVIDGLITSYQNGTYVELIASASSTFLTAAATAADSQLPLDDATGFEVGDIVSIDVQGVAPCEQVIVKAKIGNTLTTTPLRFGHALNVIVERGRKIYQMWDCNNPPTPFPHNNTVNLEDGVDSNHGIACAGLALARGNYADGIVGVAPDVKLMAIRLPKLADLVWDMFAWLAGPPDPTTQPLPNPGPDVISFSIGNTAIDGDRRNLLQRLVRRGRDGRGILFFVASGNEHGMIAVNDAAGDPFVFTVGGTSNYYDPTTGGKHETRVDYSNYTRRGADFREVTICAPTGDGIWGRNNPPYRYGLTTTTFVGAGNVPRSSANSATLASPPAGGNVPKKVGKVLVSNMLAGANGFFVDSTDGINVNDWLLLGDYGNAGLRFVQVSALPGNNLVQTTSNAATHYLCVNNTQSATYHLTAAAHHLDTFIQIDLPFADSAAVIRMLVIIEIAGNSYVVSGPTRQVPGVATDCYVDIAIGIASIGTLGIGVAVNVPANNGSPHVVACSTLHVNSTAGFVPNEWIAVGNPGSSRFEAQYVRSVNAGTNVIEISGPFNDLVPGDVINRGALDYINDFNGTSAATPLCAGVGGLILTAKPTLTWVEVREIFKRTAVRVDVGVYHTSLLPGVVAPVDPRWIDDDGDPVLVSREDVAGGLFEAQSATRHIHHAGGVPVGSDMIQVDNAAGLYAGNAVVIEPLSAAREVAIIASVDPVGATIRLRSGLRLAHADNGDLVSGIATVGVAGGGPNSTAFDVSDARVFVPGQAIRIDTAGGGHVFTSVQRIVNNTRIEVSPGLSGPIAGGNPIVGGRAPMFQQLSGGTTINNPGPPAGHFAGDRVIRVSSVANFAPHHVLIVEPATPARRDGGIIEAVDPVNSTITLRQRLVHDHANGVAVSTGVSPVVTAGAAGSATLSVDDPWQFAPGQAIKIETRPGGVGTPIVNVYTTMTSIADNGDLNIDPPLTGPVSVNDNVFGGRVPFVFAEFSGTSTLTHAVAAPFSREIFVANPWMFNEGCAVVIGNANRERHIIEEVDPVTSRITLAATPVVARAIGDNVESGQATVTGTAGVGANSVPVSNSDSFVKGQAIRITTPNGDVLTVISDIPNQTTLTVDPPILYQVNNNYPVVGGRIPVWSDYYGFGRVDAEAAVRAAAAYDHDARDLMIRNIASDNGVGVVDTAVNAILSPDIWTRTIDPAVDRAAALPANYLATPGSGTIDGDDAAYGSLAPHQNPVHNTDTYIYVRVKNRGTLLEGLRASARTYLYLARTAAPEELPIRWADDIDLWRVGYDRPAGIFQIGIAPLYDAQADINLPAINGTGQGGIKAQHHFIARMNWSSTNFPTIGPTAAERWRYYIIAEISPQDGLLGGRTFGHNNNIAQREVSFAQMRLLNPDDALKVFSAPVEVKGGGTAITPIPFRLEIDDQVGYFKPSNVQLVITRTRGNGAKAVTESATYAFQGGAWVETPDRAWLTITAPTLLSNAAMGNFTDDQIGMAFTGSLSGNQADTSFSFCVTLKGEPDPGRVAPVIFNECKSITVRVRTHGFNNLELPNRVKPEVHGFAEMLKLEQAPETAFGAASSTAFRTTSTFTVKPGVASAGVFAAATGLLFLQRVWDPTKNGTGGYDDDRVNVFIKPLYRTAISFTPVKYFVYRGLKLTDFLAGSSDIDAASIRAEGDATLEFIHDLYEQHNARKLAFETKNGVGALGGPPPTPTSDVIGWNLQADRSDKLDQYFNGWSDGSDPLQHDPVLQLPVVRMGRRMGVLSEGWEFGFEVVLEGGTFEADLAFAQAQYGTIDLLQQQLTPFAEKHMRESILSFVDPAAYYGMHWDVGVYARAAEGSSTLRTTADCYNEILLPFATRNRLYVDVRSEHGYSLNYYGNYRTDEGTLRIGSDAANLQAIDYSHQDWPIVVTERVATERVASSALYVAMPIADNPKPSVYIENGNAVTSTVADKFVVDSLLITEDEVWTNSIGVKVAQVDGEDPGEKLDVTSVVKLHYGRGVDPDKTWVAPVPEPVAELYSDNLFGPIDMVDSWRCGDNIKTHWLNANELKFVDGTNTAPDLNFGTMVERGVAFQEEQVVFFNSAIGFAKVSAETDSGVEPIAKGIEGGVSPRASLLSSSSLFDSYETEIAVVQHPPGGVTTVPINLVRMLPKDGTATPEGIMMLGLTSDQFDALKLAAEDLSDKHSKNLVLKVPDGGNSYTIDDIEYFRYSVEVRGLAENSQASTDVPPASAIDVFTRDGLTFVPAEFKMPKLIPASYTPNAEEQRAVGGNVDAVLAKNPDIAHDLAQFIADIRAIDPGAPDAKQLIKTRVSSGAAQLLARAQNTNLTDDPADIRPDDRPLYWARLRMATELKNHQFLLADSAARDEIINDLEEISRGIRDVGFSGSNKRIIIMGFDPFDRDAGTGLNKTNPSGVVALALHGTTIQSANGHGITADIQAAILPARFRDFDDGIVERLVVPFFDADPPVDMIITISQTGQVPWLNIERFAARTRGPNPDNLDELPKKPVGTGAGWESYYETTLPKKLMMDGVSLTDPDQYIYYNQGFGVTMNDGTTDGRFDAGSGGPNLDDDDPGIHLANVKEMDPGSGGDFLSNESFYRVAHIRQTPNPPHNRAAVTTGHLHIPAPQYMPKGTTMLSIVEVTRDMIARALNVFG